MKKRSDGRWQKKVKLPNGKTKFLYSSASTERLATKDFNEQLMQLETDKIQSQQFREVALKWKEDTFPTLQNNTLKQYNPCLNAAIEFFGNMDINTIEPIHIKEYVDTLREKCYAKKTIKNRISVISLIFNYGILYYGVKHNPAIRITLPKNLKETKRLGATPQDEKIIIANAGNDMISTLAYLFLVTGLRRGEAVALTPADVDTKNNLIRINKTVEWIGNKPQIKDSPKTKAGVREVPVTDKLLKLLKPYMKQKYIFANQQGEILHNAHFTRLWNNHKKTTGIECTPHQLRHSFATILFDADVDVKTAQRWLGHEDIKTTLEIYTHLSDTKIEKTTNKFCEYIENRY